MRSLPRRPQYSRRRSTLMWAACVLAALPTLSTLGCDDKPAQSEAKTTSEADKKARLDALLMENGLDPKSLPQAKGSTPSVPPTPSPGSTIDPAGAAPTPPPSASAPAASSSAAPPSALAQPAGSAGPNTPPPVAIQMLAKGQAPLKQLRYGFEKGQTRNFSLNIEIAAQRRVAGQAVPGMPPFALALRGTTTTLAADATSARRQHSFTEFVPTVPGVPPEVAAQITQQYASLRGIQLVETVSTRGVMLGMELDERAVHPQILALMQHLQDGMTNAFIPLPEAAIGAGARWIATTTTEAAGIELIQENEITLVSLQGDRAQVQLKLKQHAKSSKITGANLPPGVTIDLIKLEGSGQGSMSVQFEKVIVESQVEMSTLMETEITEAGAPAPIRETADTSMKAKISITQ